MEKKELYEEVCRVLDMYADSGTYTDGQVVDSMYDVLFNIKHYLMED